MIRRLRALLRLQNIRERSRRIIDDFPVNSNDFVFVVAIIIFLASIYFLR